MLFEISFDEVSKRVISYLEFDLDELSRNIINQINQIIITLQQFCETDDFYTWIVSFLERLSHSLLFTNLNNLKENINFTLQTYFQTQNSTILTINSYKYKTFELTKEDFVINNIEEKTNPEGFLTLDLFRITKEPTEENFKQIFNSGSLSDKYPFISIYLHYRDKIKVLECLFPIIDFTNDLLKEFSFQISRPAAKERQIKSIICSNIILAEKFEKFIQA